jgi:ABC-2 type transport system ATP-binding protein
LIAALRDKGVTVFMSTHILSDIEAMCDEVAILRGGKLAASGNLNELLASESEHRSLEISVNGVSADAIRDQIEFIAGASITPKASGAVIEVLDESDVEAALKVVRDAGGHLISIQPVKQSLEELFVREAST